jgi:hypothetical protein
MKTKDLIKLLKSKGFSHNSYLTKNSWRPGYHWKHFLMKGDCRVNIEGSIVEVEFIQSKNLLRHEGNLIGPFRDGVMFDLDSREMMR